MAENGCREHPRSRDRRFLSGQLVLTNQKGDKTVMNFELNEQQLSIQKMAREFTEKKVAPKVLERDETRVYDVELYQELSRMGFIS